MSIEESKTKSNDRETKALECLSQAENHFLKKKLDDAVNALFNIDHLYKMSSTEELSIKPQTYKSQNNEILYWSKRGNIYYEYLKRYEEAARCYEKCKKHLRLDPLVHKDLGDCSRKLLKFKEAHELYDQALDLAQRSGLSSDHVASIFHNKGLTFEKQDDFENAQNSYRMAIEKDPNNHLYLSHYGNLIAKNDPKTALEYLTKANVLLKTGNSSKLLSKANILYCERILSQIIEIKEQLDTIERAIEEAPENKKRLGSFQEAINKKNNVQNLVRQRTCEALEEIEEIKTSFNIENQQWYKEIQELKQIVKEQGIKIKEMEFNFQELPYKLTDFEKAVGRIIEAKNDEEKKKLNDYFHAFVGTISSVYITSQLVDSNLAPLNKRSFHGQLLSTLVSLIPFYGKIDSQTISNIDQLHEIIKKVGVAKKMKQLAFNEAYVTDKVSEVVCEILKNPSSEKKILSVNDDYFEKNPNSWWKKGLALLEKLGNKVDKALYGELYATPAAKLGHEDANYLIKDLLDPKKTAEFTSKLIKTRH